MAGEASGRIGEIVSQTHRGVALPEAHAHPCPQHARMGPLDLDGPPPADHPRTPAVPGHPPQPAALRTALTRFFQSRGLGGPDADDLIQEVFLRLVRRGDSAGIENLEAYAFTTAGSVLSDHFRRRKFQRGSAHVAFDPERHGGEAIGPERILQGRQALRATTRALLELPERQRRVFVLRRLEGLPFGEIALRLGVSVSTAEKDMLQAIRHVASRTGDLK
jgi:RNA polymerase sigma factor (sigma-70 family)